MTCRVSDIFDVRYGHSLELNRLVQTSEKDGVPFVSRKMGDNGISAYVTPIDDMAPAPAGDISCALGGNGVLTTCIQERPFYTGRDVAILRPKEKLTKAEILFYCLCIKSNRYRYNYGRQANKTLPELLIPPINSIPNWVNAGDLAQFEGADGSLSKTAPESLNCDKWSDFRYDELFEIKKGKRLTKSNIEVGSTPFIGAIDSNNGCRQFISQSATHEGNTITINYNGSVAEAFYQPKPYWASDDVNVLYPKFQMNSFIGLFLCTLIKQEKFRFNYGRKWHLGRMNGSIIRLPATSKGEPDWKYIEKYVKSLPYSGNI